MAAVLIAISSLVTAVAIGASLSNSLAGFVAKEWGYNASFLTMAAIAASALAFFRLRQAMEKIRTRIKNLRSKCHKQVASYLAKNYDVIVLPTFETS